MSGIEAGDVAGTAPDDSASSSVAAYRHHFPGIGGEREDQLLDNATFLVADHIRWRRELDPGAYQGFDPATRTTSPHWPEVEELAKRLHESFPLSSPRYAAHQQSDTLLASTVGLLAGTLYNGNNVTPESGLSTVRLEFEACSELLQMLGYTPPPDPTDTSDEARPEAATDATDEFAWAHLTSGGTTANIEALWVARTVRYLPLLIKEIAKHKDLYIPVEINLDRDPVDLRSVDELTALLRLRPSEALRLLDRLGVALLDRTPADPSPDAPLPPEAAAAELTRLLQDPALLDAAGFAAMAHKYPPVVFATGAAHYSMVKAMDALGMGRHNLVLVNTDSEFRMDLDDLRSKIEGACKAGRVPVAVVAVLGNTEEGTIDPIGKIVELREDLQKGDYAASFWLHVDAAWGGYFATMMRPVPGTLSSLDCTRAAMLVGGLPGDPGADLNPVVWLGAFLTEYRTWATAVSSLVTEEPTRIEIIEAADLVDAHSAISQGLAERALGHEIAGQGLWRLACIYHLYRGVLTQPIQVAPDRLDQLIAIWHSAPDEDVQQESLRRYLSDGPFAAAGPVSGEDAEYLSRSVSNMRLADSITVDPHKMGYLDYPCGAITFRDDRARDFIVHEAPYIAKGYGSEESVHKRQPIVHVTSTGGIAVDAPAKWTLEGSRPSSAATSLWLTIKRMPLHQGGYGPLMRDGLRAARRLQQLISLARPAADGFQFCPLGEGAPDSNMVLFAVRPGSGRATLEATNALTKRVSEELLVYTNGGQKPQKLVRGVRYFASSTLMKQPNYPFPTVQPFLGRYTTATEAVYATHGLTVIRCVIANPYLAGIVGGAADPLEAFTEGIASICAAVVAAPTPSPKLP